MVGYLFIAKDLGINYTLVEAFCNAGKNTNCDKVLNFKYTKILGAVTFSDATVIYFTFQAILLSILTGIGESAGPLLSILMIASFLTIPIILFSLSYQYFIGKAWCRLCLTVDVLLTSQILIFVLAIDNGHVQIGNVTLWSFFISLSVILSVGSSFLLIKRLLEKLIKSSQNEVAAIRIKNSVSVFTHLLYQQKSVDKKLFSPELVIGNPAAPISLLMVSSLHCNPCKVQHEKAAQLVSSYPDKISLTLRFSGNVDRLDQSPTANQYLLQYWKQNIYNKANESLNTQKLIHDWYAYMDLSIFEKKYTLGVPIDGSVKELENIHAKWIEQSKVTHTPAIFINGFQLPKVYTLDDIITLAPGLAHHFSTSNMISANSKPVSVLN